MDPGFTLVEVLVVMVVLAVGLLGSVALLLDGLRASRSALQRSGAIKLAADLGDRIRANRSAGPAYALDPGSLLAPPAKRCLAAGECTAPEVAARDLYEWQQTALSTLPDATTSVQVLPAGGPSDHVYMIHVRWTQTGRLGIADLALTVQA